MPRDRAVGAYLGAAIGDAMGGPVECNHAARIRRLHGRITSLLPYEGPLTMFEPHAGYALHTEPGCVTDDTFMRADFTRFLLEVPPPRTPQQLASWLLEHAEFDYWWPPPIEPLRRVQRDEVKPEEAGLDFPQGGGIGWWTPVGILHAGDPAAAAEEARSLCRIWKGPLEQQLLGAVQAGLAAGVSPGADVRAVVRAMLAESRSTAAQVVERGVRIGEEADDLEELIHTLYHEALLAEPPAGPDAPLPPALEPVEDTDEPYAVSFFAEQVPPAVASFVFADGRPDAIPTACMIGRDADSVTTTVGSWVGALCGLSGLPDEWVDTVCEANRAELDLRAPADDLADAVD